MTSGVGTGFFASLRQQKYFGKNFNRDDDELLVPSHSQKISIFLRWRSCSQPAGLTTLPPYCSPAPSRWTFSPHTPSLFETIAIACIFGLFPLRPRTICLGLMVFLFCPVVSTLLISAKRCIKRLSPMVEFTSCFLNLATGRMKKGLDTVHSTTEVINVYDCDHRSRKFGMTSSSALRLKLAITFVSRNWADGVLICWMRYCCRVAACREIVFKSGVRTS